MIATTQSLNAWLRHAYGEYRILPKRIPLHEAVELNVNNRTILSTFGQREFTALIGFIDMRGFSARASGLSPAEVRDIASPFIAAVADSATRSECFIDKTIGDEVMVVMPEWGEDVRLSSDGPARREPLMVSLNTLLVDIIRSVSSIRETQVSAAFGLGRVVLDRIGGQSFSEWTVYGNIVNAAKRLQGELSQTSGHALAVGILETEADAYSAELETWISLGSSRIGQLVLTEPRAQSRELRGVGLVRYVVARISAEHDLSG